MDSLPLVSIALATHNGERYLAQQLDSLLTQDYPNFEIVVSDDDSSDSTVEVLRRYAARDQRLRLLFGTTNLGLSANFARCFEACRGDLISPCDQDDYWYPEKTRHLVEAMGSALLVYCNSRLVDAEGRPLGNTMAGYKGIVEGNDPRKLLFDNPIVGHAMLFNRRLLEATKDMSKAVYHDWWLAFVAANIGTIKYLDEVLVDYRRHSESITQSLMDNQVFLRRRRMLDEDASRLELMAQFPGPYKSYIQRVRNAWLGWYTSYFDLRMFWIVLRDGRITHCTLPKKHGTTLGHALKYLAGHRLKRLLRPDLYPEMERAVHGVEPK